ncbi:ThiF family adenylyltransferase [Planctomycetota bacterium]
MKHKKWIKMPNGKLVRRRPDRLSLFLAENEPLLSMGTGSVYSLDGIEQTQNQHQGDHTRGYDNRNFAGCEVTIMGAGSVGSHLARALGAAGLLMNSIDYKKVQLKHTLGNRTIYDSTLVGQKKVFALKKKVEHDFPGAKVDPYPYNVGEIPNVELKSMFARSLVVVLAIDDPVQIVRISDLAYPIVELIQVAMHAGGLSGHIAVCVPFAAPCLRCTLNISGSQDIRRLDSEPANSLDIVTVVQQAARIAIDIMCSKITGQHITRWDTSKNLIYIANTKHEKISPDGPGIRFESSQKRPGCPICNSH